MSRHRRRRGGDHGEEHPDERWLVSYSDLITVLMIMFLMMYAMSSVNVSKYKALKQSTAEALGADPEGTKDPAGPAKLGDLDPKGKSDPQTAEVIAKKVRTELAKAGLSKDVSVSGETRGVVMRFSDHVLFSTASANLTGHGRSVLTKLRPALNVTSYPLVVEGHTDNRPIHTAAYPSNWELSTARSASVLHHLHAKGTPSARLSAAGYAHTKPRVSNATISGKAINRRVEIVIQTPQPTAKDAK